MGQLRILGRRGDTAVKWDVTDPASVAVAEEQFGIHTKKGFLTFVVAEDKSVLAKQIHSFDPLAEEIVVVAPVAGG